MIWCLLTSTHSQLASDSGQAIIEIASIFNELGQYLTLFEIYSESTDPELLETLKITMSSRPTLSVLSQ
jgi:hypothetical protein